MQYIKKISLYSIFPALVLFSVFFIHPETASSRPCEVGEDPSMANSFCSCDGETSGVATNFCDDSGDGGDDGGDTGGNLPPDDTTTTGGNLPPDDTTTTGDRVTGLENPIESDSIKKFLGKIIDVILVFAVPIIVLMIIYAGFVMVTAQGTPERIKQGSKTLLWAVVGGLIVLGAKIITEVIEGTIKGF